MKTFILLSAIPGAGKSTWAEQYRLTHKHVFVVGSDEVRKEVTGEFQNFTMEKEVWKRYFDYINKYALEGPEDVTVIADSTNLQNKYRKTYIEKVKGFDRKVLVVLKKPLDVILRQNLQRSENKIVPENIVISMWKSWEEPSEEIIDWFDEYMVIYKWFDSSKVKDSFHYKD